MFFKTFFISAMIILGHVPAFTQKIIPLYKGAIPNSKKTVDEETSKYLEDNILNISKVSRPTLTIYLPPKKRATGVAVIIYPGGGYWVVSAGHEGADVAKRFNEMGIAAFVVKYRLPDDKTMIDKSIGPLQDAQQAIRIVRSNAKKWHINQHKIGVIGFSAGAHLASTAGTHFKTSFIKNSPAIDLRPDFMILIYPVISFADSIGHMGSRDQLIGKNPSAEKIKEYSNDQQVTPGTPPTFLVHAKNDDAVSVKNSIAFVTALKKNQVPVEMYLFEKGGHGFGMINKSSNVKWMDLIEPWIKRLNDQDSSKLKK